MGGELTDSGTPWALAQASSVAKTVISIMVQLNGEEPRATARDAPASTERAGGLQIYTAAVGSYWILDFTCMA